MTDHLQSMTGFARSEGAAGPLRWAWELRSVNSRGLDLRFRLPGGFDALEPVLRDAAQQAVKRGNVTANLQIKREDTARTQIDTAALDQWLNVALQLAARIPGAPPPRAETLLTLPGVLRSGATEAETTPADQQDAVRNGFVAALADLLASRRAEGARLHALLRGHLTEIAALCDQARHEAADQPALQQARMQENLAALLRDTPGLPAERIAQEIALLAGRSDVREELDRLDSHLQAAHALLTDAVPIGRRFDFLTQEFVRETNTLCSKSASIPLTATGLKLKAVIEQMREQVQNVE